MYAKLNLVIYESPQPQRQLQVCTFPYTFAVFDR
jgi:hypothetical protein